MPTLKFILTFFLLTLISSAQMEKELMTEIHSTNYVTGEKGYIAFAFFNRDLDTPPPEIVSPGLNIQPSEHYGTVIKHRRVYVYVYSFAAVKPGSYTIPPVSFDYYGKILRSDPVDIRVIDREKLRFGTHTFRGKTVPYYSYLFKPENQLYPGEAAELEYKIYLPERTRVIQWGVPTPETLENCTAWRFSTPNNAASTIGEAIVGGLDYQVASFKTVFSGIEPGSATIGKIESRIAAGVAVTDPRRGSIVARTDLVITHPPVELTIKPFPTTPPQNFNGAVGTFTLESPVSTKTHFKDTDTIRKSITISGTGNLPNLVPPTLANRDSWLLIDSSRKKQGEERKSINGSVEFNFILRPQPNATTTPEFKFTYFNPALAEFKTLTTQTAPVSVETSQPPRPGIPASATAGSNNPTQKDILGPITEVNQTPTKSLLASIPAWTLHTVPAAILAYLLGTAFIQKQRTRKLQNSETTLRQSALRKLENTDEDFLKAAGAYIQRWLNNKDDDRLREILNQRDKQAYLPDHDPKIPESRKKEILSILKKLSLILFLFALATPKIQAANALSAWQNNDFSTALERYQNQLESNPNSPDLHYNIGNCHYRLNQPGRAALHYERALALQPNHPEARANLDFIRAQNASILPPPLEDIQAWIAKLSPAFYFHTALLAAWTILICLIFLYLRKPRAWKLATTLTLLALAPIILGTAGYAYFNHPKKNPTSETADAVILTGTSVLTEPIRPLPGQADQKTLLTAPPTTPCRILAKRGSYTYIELPGQTRGWVPTAKAAPVQPR